MPLIEVKFIEGVVAPDLKTKEELIAKLTETFIEVCGEVTRPFVYCLIEEVKPRHWAIAGKPMPDLEYLTGKEHAKCINDANNMMKEMMAQTAQ